MVTVNPDPIPDELKERDQWLLWDASTDTPRQPHWNGNFGVSWSDPDDWHSFEEAVEAAESRDSWGIGYVMALDNDDHARGLYTCVDIDGGVADKSSDKPHEWVPSLQEFIDTGYVEYSPSGDGIHIPLVGQDAPEWWRDQQFADREHEGVDYLTNKFCTFTGDTLPNCGDTVADTDPTPFLLEVWREINGELPNVGSDDSNASYDGDDELDREIVESALSELDPGMGHGDWIRLAFAVHDWDDGSTGKSVFESWSSGSSKYDATAERQIEGVWSSGSQGSDVTVGTLIYMARQQGWEFPTNSNASTDGGMAAQPSQSGDTTPTTDEGDGRTWDGVRDYYRDVPAGEMNKARYEAAELLLENHHWRNFEENDRLYWYDQDNGVFQLNGESQVRTFARQGLREQFARQEVGELKESIRAATTVTQDEMGGPDGTVAVANGVLDLQTRELHDHSPSYNFLSRLGTKYDPEADCPRFKEFLDDVVTDGTDKKKLQEFAGYSLMHWRIEWAKSLFIVGPQASGKSTFVNTIRDMHGEQTVASLSPQGMVQRFKKAQLFDKWVNIRNDIPKNAVKNTGEFKEIIAGEEVDAEDKGKDPFSFRPRAKHIFAGNQLPDTSNDDGAFYRRILLVAFPRTIPRNERDSKLDEKLQAELPGVLNWALEGLDRLREQGGFTGDLSPQLTADKWDKWGHTADRFMQACLETASDPDPKPKGEVYQLYQQFCEQENMPCEMQQAFTRRLKTEHGVVDGRAHVDGGRERCFMNVEYTGRADRYRDGGNGLEY